MVGPADGRTITDVNGTEVVVVGAGPTGLTLALQAHDHGADVRVVDRRSGPVRPSRAMIMYPRTLEVLRPLGVSDALLARGNRRPTVALHLGRHVVPAGVGDLPLPDTAFPHLLLIRQSDVEAVLLQAVLDRGLQVEWNTEFETVRLRRGGPVATVRRDGAVIPIQADFLVGADGSTSRVRSAVGIGFHGAAYAADVVLADVELIGVGTASAHAVAARGGLILLFPLGEQAAWRMLATVPATSRDQPFGQLGPPVSRSELDLLVDSSGVGAHITDVTWSSRIRVQRRLASSYRSGPVLLAGDAAHTFSPAGGQGMNTGIQDATNLGWKLAMLSATGNSDGPLVASYEAERRHVAQLTSVLTHLLFWGEAGSGVLASVLRGSIAPLAAPIIPVLLKRRRLTAPAFRVLSQLSWNYRGSPLSIELGARVRAHQRGPHEHPGDRMGNESLLLHSGRHALHDLTATTGFSVLLHRDADAVVVPDGLVQVYRVLSWPGRDVLVVRPDGYLGYRGPTEGAVTWLALAGVRGYGPPADQETAVRG